MKCQNLLIFGGKKRKKYFKMSYAEFFYLICKVLREIDTFLWEVTVTIVLFPSE